MKITKQKLKQIIMEEVGPVRGSSHGGMLQHMYVGQGNLRNFAPTGEPPDNSTREPMTTRPPYETLGVKSEIVDGQIYLISGKTRYKLEFDDKDLSTGRVVPFDEYKFTIDNGQVTWFDNAPAHVRFDQHLEKEIMEFSGRED